MVSDPSSTIAGRFIALREHFGRIAGRKLSQREMAEWLNVAKNSWQRYETGELPGSQILLRLAAEGINTHWLLTGIGQMDGPPEETAKASHAYFISEARNLSAYRPQKLDELTAAGYVLIPRYSVAAAAGAGVSVGDEELVDHVAFKREWLHRALGVNPADLVVMTVRGDSNLPRLKDGDMMLLDRSEPKLRSGNGFYVFDFDGLLYVKRLEKRLDGGLRVSSDNEELHPAEYIGPDRIAEVRIIGRVLWSAGQI